MKKQVLVKATRHEIYLHTGVTYFKTSLLLDVVITSSTCLISRNSMGSALCCIDNLHKTEEQLVYLFTNKPASNFKSDVHKVVL